MHFQNYKIIIQILLNEGLEETSIAHLYTTRRFKSYIRTKIIVWQVGPETMKVDSFDDYITDGYRYQTHTKPERCLRKRF